MKTESGKRKRNEVEGSGQSPAGFTLVELMVVIVIVTSLAAMVFALAQKGKTAATKATCINGLRQSAGIMLSSASDASNRLSFTKGGPGNFDLRPYFVVANELGLDQKEPRIRTMEPLMSCSSVHEKEGNRHWNCFGVNFINSPERGVTWKTAKVRDGSGREATGYTLHLGSVRRVSDHVLLADSCKSDGNEIFRIHGKDLIGLRHKGFANAAFLDGSVRSLSKADLGRLGFDKAYDTSVSPPELVELRSDR